MTTPLLMLAMMLAPALLVLARATATGQPGDTRAAAAIGLGILFAFTASGHWIQKDATMQMLPPWVPARGLLVHLTGLLEIAIALGFFVPAWRKPGRVQSDPGSPEGAQPPLRAAANYIGRNRCAKARLTFRGLCSPRTHRL